MIGSKTDYSSASGNTPYGRHEGYSGYDTFSFNNYPNGQLTDGFANTTLNLQPNYVLLMMGTNDINNGNLLGASARLNGIITKLANKTTGRTPNAKVIVASIINQTGPRAADVATYNADISGIVAQHFALGESVYYLDMNAALTTADLADTLHPNQVGYNKMGDAWADAIKSVQGSSPGTPPPGEWSLWDIGSPGQTGGTTVASGEWTVKGGGTDIWGSSDQFAYTYLVLNGDGSLTAKLETIQNTDAWAKAGVMVRESLDANSKNAAMFVSASNGTAFQARATTGGSTTYAGGTGSAPRWVRITRAGSTLTGASSTDGQSWTTVGSATVSMQNSIYIGLAVTSHNNALLNTSTFSNISSAATSAISTGGTASASSVPISSEGPAQAFDQNAGTKWLGAMSNGVNLTYQFANNTAYTLTSYKIVSANDEPTRHPTSWTITGSNDGTTWSAALDTRTGQSYGSAGTVNTYNVSNSGAYRYYRLTVSANGGASLIQIADWTLYGSAQITSVISTGGTASASSAPVGGEGAAQAFDQNAGTKWLGNMSNDVNLTYQFSSGASRTLTSYQIVSANDAPGRHPASWTVTGSNNGTTWSAPLDTRSGQTYGSAGTVNTYNVTNSGAYQYYRLTVSANGGDGLIQIGDWTLIGN